jgi:enterochelin esterase family protein
MSRLLIVTLFLIGTATLGQERVGLTKPASPDDQYVLGPDSQPQAGVPEGKVLAFELKDSRTYPGFQHKWWLYVPAQYDKKKPAALMVFQDGQGYVSRDGTWRVPVVLNNLIAKKEIPVMAAVFINSGISEATAPDGSPLETKSNRSVEYDTLGNAYATFVLEEILPEVRKYVRITDDPEGRGIAGGSSGGVCAFTVAWQRPDQFRKVLSFIGSFVNIRGGDVYPELVRQSEKKPIRIFQQDGARDSLGGIYSLLKWPEANKAMAAALDEKGYDHKFVFGEGSHSGAHGASIFPDAMRWLWRDYPR